MQSASPKRIAVLGSGKGSNFEAIAALVQAGQLPGVEIAGVWSDVAEAGILGAARRFGVPSEYLNPGKFRTKLEEEIEEALVKKMKALRVDFVVLAGFMRVLKGCLLQQFPHAVVNIHPSLLPAFPGLEAWKQALNYGVRVTGCTVHLVDQGVDTGPILAQEAVPVLPGDTVEALHARIQEAERRIYPATIARLARGEFRVEGRRVVALPPAGA